MSRGELAVIVGVLLCAVGAGLFHPGAGFIVAGLGLAALGVASIRFADEPAEEAVTARPQRNEPGADEERAA